MRLLEKIFKGTEEAEIRALNEVALQKTKFTPDIAALERSQFQLVFICDDLMRAGVNYKIIADSSAQAARGYTMKHYQFFRRRTDNVGVVMRVDMPDNRYNFHGLKIKGELHYILSSAMIKLDTHYQNGVQFRRKRVQILYPTRQHGQVVNRTVDGKPLPPVLQGNKHFLLPERVEPIEAWMYIGIPGYWNDLLDGGFLFEQVRIVEPKEEKSWLVKYYSYQNRP